MAVFLSVLLAVTMLFSGVLLTLASNNDGATSTTSFTQHYETDRPDGEYYVTKVIVERERVYTVRFFLGEDSDKVFVGSVKVKPGDCIPPYDSIEGVATVNDLLVEPEEFHGWYYYDTDGGRVDVPDPAEITVLSDMDLFADLYPRLPRAIEFVFYGYEARQVSVYENGEVKQRWIANLNSTPTPVYTSYVVDGKNRTNITWMFVEEAYNRWQVNGYNKDSKGEYTIPNGEPNGMKPEFFANPKMMWKVYDNITPSNESFVAERGYNDFVYRPVPFTLTTPPYTTYPEVTFYMDYAIKNSMEFIKKVNDIGVEYLVATFHVYPIHLTEFDPPPPGEGGVQGEDEE